jgi:hypothetical protein
MLSHAVMSVIQVFYLLWYWVGLCLCESVVVFHLSGCELTMRGSMLWFEQWLEWWRWLILSWHVVFESAKDQILGVDTPGQYVSPRVRYGTTCLLIRNTIGSVSCSVGWELTSYFVIYLNHMVQEGTFVWKTLALQAGSLCSRNRSKAWHTLVVGLYQWHVVISGPCTKGSVRLIKKRFL